VQGSWKTRERHCGRKPGYLRNIQLVSGLSIGWEGQISQYRRCRKSNVAQPKGAVVDMAIAHLPLV
jgi:hypothetical protein